MEDEDEGDAMDNSEVDTNRDMGRSTNPWPDSHRIDIIGQNGNEGSHYNYDKCVTYDDDDV